MNAFKMDTGTFRMAPLDEFVVTVKKFGPKPQMEWHEWYLSAGYPSYEMKEGHRLIFKDQKEPDVEVVMPENDPPYELIWAK